MTSPLGATGDGQPTTNGQLVSDKEWQAAITEAVEDICDRRAVIEQVKGVVMCVYGLDADAAFEPLRWRFQENTVKLRDLAWQLMIDFRSLATDDKAGLSAKSARIDVAVDTSITAARPRAGSGQLLKKSPAVGQTAATLELATDVGQVAFVFCC